MIIFEMTRQHEKVVTFSDICPISILNHISKQAMAKQQRAEI
jgi:hypothetical protein